ncbi:hypothetical protein A5880_000580 [Enterococcus sp. 4G2_DIV0659]|uniref:Uncharacterized protein n=1 Tax=Candidatus Enterococcus mansonii TaxID=1834181 RepID=A0ABU8IC59_9ENTE
MYIRLMDVFYNYLLSMHVKHFKKYIFTLSSLRITIKYMYYYVTESGSSLNNSSSSGSVRLEEMVEKRYINIG